MKCRVDIGGNNRNSEIKEQDDYKEIEIKASCQGWKMKDKACVVNVASELRVATCVGAEQPIPEGVGNLSFCRLPPAKRSEWALFCLNRSTP